MKLDRNITNPRRGKYALIKLREGSPRPMDATITPAGDHVITSYEVPGSAVDFGDTEVSEFFVIRLKDKYAEAAFLAYADAAYEDDPEYAREINRLALLASMHPNKKKPD